MLGYDLGIFDAGVRSTFCKEFIARARKTVWQEICTVVPSDKKTETYKMLSSVPALERLMDEVTLHSFSEYEYALTNLTFKTGFEIERDVLEFDQTGQTHTFPAQLGSRSASHPDKYIAALLKHGATSTITEAIRKDGIESTSGYDGTTFFSTSHALADESQPSSGNLLTGTLSADDLTALGSVDGTHGGTKLEECCAQFTNDLNNAIVAMANFKDSRGEPWHESIEPESLVLICGPEMVMVARAVIEGITNVFGGGGTNPMVKSVGRIIVMNRDIGNRTGDNPRYGTFYLCKVDTPVRPFLLQSFTPKTIDPSEFPEVDPNILTALAGTTIESNLPRVNGPMDSQFILTEKIIWAVRRKYAMGYGIWQNCVKSVGLPLS